MIYEIKFSNGKNLNDSLNMSVKAVETRSFMSGFTKGNPSFQVALIKKSIMLFSRALFGPKKFEICKLIPPM